MEPSVQDHQREKEVRRVEHLGTVDWNAEIVRGDLGQAVLQLGKEPGKGLLVGGVDSPAGVGRAGINRRVRVRGTPQAGGPQGRLCSRGCRSIST